VSSLPAAAPSVAVARAPRDQSRLRALFYAPALAWAGALVLIPNVLLLVYSFWQSESGLILHNWNLENYRQVVDSQLVRTLVLRTVGTALGAAALAAAIGYPMAYFVWRRLGRHRQLAVLLVLVPLWVSYLVRVFAWKIILGGNGILNSALVHGGVLSHPSSAFLYSRFAVFLTLTYVAIPYVFVTSYTALERIPEHLLEASNDSGAPAWRTFLHVVFPLSKQGLGIGFALAFLLATGDYITPQLVGGLNGTMLGAVIVSEFGLASNWPLGAAMALSLLAIVVLLLGVLTRLVRVEAVLE
jgi:ABC-type spermidine/putrescine transport system permease subunit I